VDKLVQLTEDEFEHIEDTIARTAKGRAFLRRYARRTQGGSAEEVRLMLLQMREMLNRQNQATHTATHIDVLRRELLEMAGSIEKARREVAALRPPDSDDNRILSATSELDAIVTSTERASFDILNSAERLMELSTKMRRAGGENELCAELEGEVTNIFTACSFQDLTGQRTSKVVNALRYIEQRINAMIAIWGHRRGRGIRRRSRLHRQATRRPSAGRAGPGRSRRLPIRRGRVVRRSAVGTGPGAAATPGRTATPCRRTRSAAATAATQAEARSAAGGPSPGGRGTESRFGFFVAGRRGRDVCGTGEACGQGVAI
jgi:chemotaxis regulatin CheY-phosphate phosphatase CheZ